MRRRYLMGLVMVVACSVRNPALPDAGLNARCENATDCAAPFGMCVAGRCGDCDTSAACPVEKPVCGDDHQCKVCDSNSQCASGACDPSNGSCVADSDILYVAPGGSTQGTCTMTTPCLTIQQAITAASGSRHWIEIAAGQYREELTIADKSVELIGAGQTTTDLAAQDGDLAVITIARASAVGIQGMKVRSAFGTNAHGIYCMAGNVALTVTESTIADNAGSGVKSCNVTLLRSTISGSGGPAIDGGSAADIEDSTLKGNTGVGVHSQGTKVTLRRSFVQSNAGGGLDIELAPFVIENSMITKNGGSSGTIGGISIVEPTAGSSVRFSTIAENDAQLAGVGVNCASNSGALTFDDDIVYGNKTDGGEMQVAGTGCTWMRSLIGPQAVGQNINMDPQFVDPANGDFHIRVVSPAKDAADATNAPADDVDGDARPQGAGFDLGADEVHE